MLQEARKHANFLVRRNVDRIIAPIKAFVGKVHTGTFWCIEQMLFQKTRENGLYANFLANIDRITARIKAFVGELSARSLFVL